MAQPTITVLRCDSQVSLDPEPLALIYAEQGEDAAEETMCRALEDVARRLNAMQKARKSGAYDVLGPQAGRLAVIAAHIGLGEIATAGQHVARACAQFDGVAVEATLNRLERAFDAAVNQVWHFRDLFEV